METNENVVTAVGEDYFFIQTPAYRSDNNQATSDGLIIVTNNTPSVEIYFRYIKIIIFYKI